MKKKISNSKYDNRGLGNVRKSLGLTQLELGIRMGYSRKIAQQCVAGIESNRTSPSLSLLERYARALGCRLKLQFIPLSTKANAYIE